MVLYTQNLEQNSIVSTGFLMTHEESNFWDGLKISFVYSEDVNSPTMTYSVQDIHIADGSAGEILDQSAAGLPGDSNSADWMAAVHKSWYFCEEERCKFNIHLQRDFVTEDEQDIDLLSGEATLFNALGFYEAQMPSEVVQKAVSGNVLIELGARQLLTATSAVLCGLVALTF